MVQLPGTATCTASGRMPVSASAGTSSGVSNNSSDHRPSSPWRRNPDSGTCIASRFISSTDGSAQGRRSPITGSTGRNRNVRHPHRNLM